MSLQQSLGHVFRNVRIRGELSTIRYLCERCGRFRNDCYERSLDYERQAELPCSGHITNLDRVLLEKLEFE